MKHKQRVYNFSAGPAALPLSVLQEAQRNLLCLPGAGMSVLEMSHRSSWFEGILHAAEANLRKLYQLPDRYHVLFLQGGASLQFSMLAMNFLRESGKSADGRHADGQQADGQHADYVVTGAWAQKALKEAQREGAVHVAWDGKPDHYSRVPTASELKLTPGAAYVHITSNETIQGVQFEKTPDTSGAPLICDMSSDFLSRPIDAQRYGMIYAGAQKNAGGSGVTIVILQDELLNKAPEGLPSMLDYRLQAEHKSLYNTPSTFAVYLVMLVTRWLLEEVGGLEHMARINDQKAHLLYEAIDCSESFYRGHARPDSRSTMNVTWRMAEEALEKEFLKEAQARGLYELKGHRSVGGMRASIYNAMTLEGVQALRDFMDEFRKRHG